MKHLKTAATFIPAIVLSLGMVPYAKGEQAINLSGEWLVVLEGDTASHYLTLPGTTDYAGIGIRDTLTPMLAKPQLLHLTRKNRFVGNASYSKEITINEQMAGKPLRLRLERVMWKSRLEIDGKDMGEIGESLTTPHECVISDGLSAGKHKFTLHIDNSKHYEISTNNLAHAYTDDTQIMWNGVLGAMTLEVIPDIDIRDIQVYPDVDSSRITIKASIDSRLSKGIGKTLFWKVAGFNSGNELSGSHGIILRPGRNEIEFSVNDPLLGDALWSEFNPEVLTLGIGLKKDKESKSVNFGMREIRADGNTLTINGNAVFLRGTLECCVFPLTGTPPTDEESWEKMFGTARTWGLNHLRFHSWCPPEAAFDVADRMGFYLQVESPLWSVDISAGSEGENGKMKKFIRKEIDAIVSTYGNHPSFCLMTIGNELQKDFEWLNDMTRHMQETDPRHLYAATSFTFEKGHGGHPEENDDFIVTQWTDDGWVRGQGIFDKEPPSFDKNYASAVASIGVPLIEHEIGQYAVYPDLSEIGKYTGVLTPHNLIAVRNDLEKKGRLGRSGEYLMASGKLASLLYKEELERALKTPGVSGIQMLGLQDFPGQGTALIGLLNAFWETKGIVGPKWFRQFCSPMTPLADFEKAVYEEGEQFEAKVSVADYSDFGGAWTCSWSLKEDDMQVADGNFSGETLEKGLNSLGMVSVTLPELERARKLKFSVTMLPDSATNSWNIWVYPKDHKFDYEDIVVTSDREVAIKGLREGRKVLFSPETNYIAGTKSKFVPVFWSPVHFPEQAGAMGVLCDPTHPALVGFPNDGHTDWQWWYPLKRSVYVDISAVDGVVPLIEMVDNFTTNHELALIFETRIGEGRLLFSSIDLLTQPDQDPATRALLKSLIQYMKSEDFSPSANGTEEMIDLLLKRKID